MKRLPLAERAELIRKIATEHRTLAANIPTTAERLEADARLMDAGSDPYEGRAL